MGHDEVAGSVTPAPAWLPQDPPTPLDAAPTAYPAPTSYPAATPFPVATPFAAATPCQGPYGAPPQQYMPPPPTPTLAVIGLVLAILVAPAGLIVSIVALAQSKKTGVGRGLSIAGIVVGSVPLVAAIAIPIFLNARLADERGPRHAMEDMESALVDGDCYAFQAVTTARLREQFAITECGDFDALVAAFDAAGGGPGVLPIIDVESDGHTATVTTVERVDGVAGGQPVTERLEYVIVERDGRWLVDSVALAD